MKIVRYPNRDMRTIVDERVNLCLSLEGTVYRHVSGKNNASGNADVSITMNHFWRTDEWDYKHMTITPEVDDSDLESED